MLLILLFFVIRYDFVERVGQFVVTRMIFYGWIDQFQFYFINNFNLCLIFLFARYYHNITSNTLLVLEAMAKHDVKTLIYSSTCATYGEPEKMPITEETKQVGIQG